MKGILNLTSNYIALWECIRSRTQENCSCSKAVIRDDMRLKGFDVDKKFSQWLGKLVDVGIVVLAKEQILPKLKI